MAKRRTKSKRPQTSGSSEQSRSRSMNLCRSNRMADKGRSLHSEALRRRRPAEHTSNLVDVCGIWAMFTLHLVAQNSTKFVIVGINAQINMRSASRQ